MYDDAHASGVAYPQPFATHALALCRSAARYIRILSPDLDSDVFSTNDLTNALSALARDTRQPAVRILVSDIGSLTRQTHRLLALARRLPSSVKLRVLQEHPDWSGATLVIRDHDGVLYKHSASNSDGVYEPDSRAATQRHLEQFDEFWRFGIEDPELRSMRL